jgi:aldose sugar dehydrogenase
VTYRKPGLWAAAIVALAVMFAAGIGVGRWAVKSQMFPRLRNQLATPETWSVSNTQLVRLEAATIHLPRADGWGGGIKALPDGRIVYATGHGGFGMVGVDGKVTELPFGVDINLDALERHPVFHAPNFNPNWVRVTDIHLTRLDDRRHELLVGHHHFDAARQCIELWLSRAEIETSGAVISLAAPFRKVMSTAPCISFAGPAAPDAFAGWSSGGRILSMGNGEVLFSTGDHNWAGVRGYPALAQDEASTLGKILRVNTTTNQVRPFAKGVRNPQGLARDSKGRIWDTEHGPRGGDELNLIVEGGNYGWPNATLGTDYGPLPWPLNPAQGRHDSGTPPVFAWEPSIGVSNLMEVTGDEFPLWRGDLLVLSLAQQTLHRLRLEGDRVLYDEAIPFFGHRLRDLTPLPDGRLAVLTDEGDLLLLRNADRHGRAPYLDARRQFDRSIDMPPEQRARVMAGGYGAESRPSLPSPSTAAIRTASATPQGPGQQVFQSRCARCHSALGDEPGVAPSLAGLVGRRIGSTGYPYSRALLDQPGHWTARDAAEFAVAPSAHFPGAAMAPVAMTSDEQRELAVYLDKLR